jgi:hypothetical protein
MSYVSKDLSPLIRGDDWTIKLEIQSDGVPLDIAGYKFYLTLKADIDDADPGALQVSVTAPADANSTAGIAYIVATDLETAVLAAITYHYDIQQIDTSGKVQTLQIGKVKVTKDVTLATS